MSSISAGTTTGTALVSTGDTTGELVLKTNGTTTAVTIGTDQVVTLAQALPVASGGTGAATLTANNVLLGNGTSAVQVVAPGTTGNVLTSNGTTWASTAPSGGITSGTAVASTSGTSISFTGIPSTVKRITLMLRGVSVTAENMFIRIGSGSFTTSGYVAVTTTVTGTNAISIGSSTVGFPVTSDSGLNIFSGSFTLSLVSGNDWVIFGGVASRADNNRFTSTAGGVTLSGVLDRIQIITEGGETFDAGTINILYE
jgi:hypothetical protein